MRPSGASASLPGSAGLGPPGGAWLSRLRVRLLLLVGLSILPALALVVWTAFEQRAAGRAEASASASRIVHLAARAFQQSIESARQLLTVLAQLDVVRERDVVSCHTLFTNLLQLHRVYANLGLIGPDGDVFVSAVSLQGRTNLSDRAYFQLATNTMRFAVGEFQMGRLTGRRSINVGYPVRDETSGTLALVAFAALDLKWLNQHAARADLPEGSTVTVIDRKGTILVRYPTAPDGTDWVGRSVHERPDVRQLLRSGQDTTGASTGLDSVERLYSTTPLTCSGGVPDGHVIVGIPTRVAYASANRQLAQNLLFLAVVSALALGAAWVGGDHFILRQVRNLVDATKRLSAGDLKARSGLEYGPGEIGQLAKAFDEMAGSLEQRIAERERAESQLQALNQDLEQRVAERTQELKRSNQDLEQFAFVASHDLQEPLRMVTNYMNLLESRYKPKLDAPAQEFIAFASDGATRMQRLINDLLTYSRVNTRREPFQPCDLEDVLERALINLRASLSESGGEVTHDPMPTIRGDETQLLQLFQNLVGNALKFRGAHKPLVHISAQLADKPDANPPTKEWLVGVRDNGIGIPPQEFERIFIVFQRLHSREKYPGTGIGLAICKKIVERHDGRIWVESKVGEGTTFYFTMPASDGTK